MAEAKPIYAIAAAVFAGLLVIAVTNNSNIISPTNDLTGITGEQSAFAQYSPIVGIRQNVITVSGSASTSADPDQVVVSLGIETQATTASQATTENAIKMDSVVNALKEIGITEDEMSTSSFQISPVYDKNRQFITAYRTSNILTIKTDQLEKASDIIDGATEAGANRVNSIFFTLSDDVRKRLSDQLIGEAVKDAEKKAELALEPLARQIVGVKSVSLEHFAIPQPVMFDRFAEAGIAGAPPTQIFESEQQVSMSVNVIFLIK